MHFKNLVLSGAQIKGLSYIGVGKAMKELNLMNFENILGVSSGAIFAFTLAVNLEIKDIENLVLGINKEHLMDINLDNILQFTESYGFDSGKKFEKIFKILCNKILGNENATFEDRESDTTQTRGSRSSSHARRHTIVPLVSRQSSRRAVGRPLHHNFLPPLVPSTY